MEILVSYLVIQEVGNLGQLVALGGHAVRTGQTVLHYTLELGEDYVGRRYDAFFCDVDVSKIGFL